MQRTQVYTTKERVREFKALPRDFNEGLDSKIYKKKPTYKKAGILGTVGMIKGGPRDGSVKHDKYLYFFKK